MKNPGKWILVLALALAGGARAADGGAPGQYAGRAATGSSLAKASSFAQATEDRTEDGESPVLHRQTGNIEGKVIIAGTGEPVAGVMLRLQGTNSASEPVLSGADGSFRLTGVPAGRAVITALFPGEPVADWVAEDVAVTVAAGETRRDVVIRALKGGVAEVRVLSSEDHKPLADVPIAFASDFSKFPIVVKTGADGLAQARLLPDAWQISHGKIEGDTFVGQTVLSVLTGQTNRMEHQIGRARKITGVVHDPDGSPAGGVVVSIAGADILSRHVGTDGTGRYELTWWDESGDMDDNDDCFLMALSADRELKVVRDITAGVTNQDLTLQPTVTISAKVEDPTGKPVTNATAIGGFSFGKSGYELGGDPHKADARGYIEFTGIPKADVYGLIVTAKGYRRINQVMPMPRSPTNRLVYPTFVLPLANQKLGGQILDADGKPAAGILVKAWAISHVVHPVAGEPDAWDVSSVQGRFQASMGTDSQGKFFFDEVCEGPIKLNLTIQGRAVAVETTGGTTNIVLRLTTFRANNPAVPSLTISGTVRDPSGAPAAGVAVMCGNPMYSRDATTDSLGRYSIICQKTEGAPVLVARDEPHNLAATHEIDGTTTNLDLDLKPGLTLSVQVRDVNGLPIPSATETLFVKTEETGWLLSEDPARANEQGRIEIKSLPQGLSFTSKVTSRGFGTITSVVPLEATLTNRLELPAVVLRVADRKVAGQVLEPGDLPMSDAVVRLKGDGQTEALVTTDAHGRFAFHAVCEGPVTLRATPDVFADEADGVHSVKVNAKAGDTNILIKWVRTDAVPAAVAPGNGQIPTNGPAILSPPRP